MSSMSTVLSLTLNLIDHSYLGGWRGGGVMACSMTIYVYMCVCASLYILLYNYIIICVCVYI